MNGYVFLGLAILAEIVGTSALKAAEGFTRWVPTMIAVLGYVAATYFLSLSMKTIPMGIIYALWSGIGIVAITLIGYVCFQQKLDWAALAGIILIGLGVVVMNFFSTTKTIA